MKNRIVKCFVLAAYLLLCLYVLSGCHGSKGLVAFEVPEEFDTSRSHEITFWAKNDTNLTQVAIYESAIDGFEKLYPNIKVNLRLYTDYGRIYNDVITNISTNTTPNVCITYPDQISTYLTGTNSVVALEDLMTDPGYGLGGSRLLFDSPRQDEIVPQFLSECKLNGRYYALPYMRSTEACYINKTYVEALGYTLPDTLTWDFIWEVSEAATAKDEEDNYLINGQKVMIPFIYKSTDNMMIQLLRQYGAGYSNDDGDILIFNDTTREVLKTVACHAQTGAFSTFKISSYPANFLNAGQCIFAIDSTAGATWMGPNAPLIDISEDKLVDFEVEIMPIPQMDPANPQMISQGPSVCIFNKEDPQEVMASWLFTQYLLTNDVQIAYAGTEGYVPVTLKAQQSDKYQDYIARCGEDGEEHYSIKIRASQLLMDNTQHTFVTPVYNGSASLRNAAGQMIEDVTKSVRRKKSVDDAFIDKLYSDMTSLYRLDQIENNLSDGSVGEDLGPLPAASVVLLGTLGTLWLLIIAYLIRDALKKKKAS